MSNGILTVLAGTEQVPSDTATNHQLWSR